MNRMIVLACLLVPLNVFAVGTWEGGIDIKSIQTLPDGSLNIRTNTGYLNSCGDHASPFTVKVGERNVTQEGLNAMLSITTAAMLAASSLNINYDPDLSCQSNSITISK